MRKFKLIKEYPGSPTLGSVAIYDNGNGYRVAVIGFYCLKTIEEYPEYWEEIKQLDFEVLEFEYIPGRSGCNMSPKDSSHYWENCNIKSIKRLSDGEIFSIGNNISTNVGNLRIKNFFIVNDNIYIGTYSNNVLNNIEFQVSFPLNGFSKAKQPILITEDGVEAYAKDVIYRVSEDYSIKTLELDRHDTTMFGHKYFYSIVAANDYIDENKPRYSKKEIREAIYSSFEWQNIVEPIKYFKLKLGL